MIAGLIAGFARTLTGASVRWLDPPAEGQRIYFANHTSHADFITIWAALPPSLRAHTRPVAAADYWEGNALRRWLAVRVFRAVLIDRGKGGAMTGGTTAGAERGRVAIEEIVAALHEGDSLIIFPEGTRGEGTEIGAFKSGLYHLAVAAPDVDLVPVRLENLSRVLPKGEVIPVPVIARLTFGPPLRLGPDEPRDSLLERARSAVATLDETPLADVG